MASLCKRQQCTIERRGFRQELDSWRHKLIHCVGFESILEGLFGPGLAEDLRLFKDCEPEAVSDWSFDENCLFCCLKRDKVKEHLVGLSNQGLDDTPKPLLVKDQSKINRLEKQAEEFLNAVLYRKDIPSFSDPHIPVVAREIMQRMIRQFAAEYTSKSSSSQDSVPDPPPPSDQSLPRPPSYPGVPPATSPGATVAASAHNQNPVLSKLLMADQDSPLDLTIKKPPAEPTEQDGVLDLSLKKNRHSSSLPAHSPYLSPATTPLKGESLDLRTAKAKDLQSTSTLTQFMAKLCSHHQRQIVDALGFLQTEVKAIASSSTSHASNPVFVNQGATTSSAASSLDTPVKAGSDAWLPISSTPKGYLEAHEMSPIVPGSFAKLEKPPETPVTVKTSTNAGPPLDLRASGPGATKALVSPAVDAEKNRHSDHAPLKMKIMKTSNLADGKKLSCVLTTALIPQPGPLEEKHGLSDSSNRAESQSARLSSPAKRHSHTHQARQRDILGHTKDATIKPFSAYKTFSGFPPDSPRTARKTIRGSSDHRTRDSACRVVTDPDLGHCDIVYIDKPITECLREQRRHMHPRRNARKSTRGHMYVEEMWELKTVRTLADRNERGNYHPNPLPELITLVTPKQMLSKHDGVPPVDMPFAGGCVEMVGQQTPSEQADDRVIAGTGDVLEAAGSEHDIIVETSQTDQSLSKEQSTPSSPLGSPTENTETGASTDVGQDTANDSGQTVERDLSEEGVVEETATDSGETIERDSSGDGVVEETATDSGQIKEGDVSEEGVVEELTTDSGQKKEGDSLEEGVVEESATDSGQTKGDLSEESVVDDSATDCGQAIERDLSQEGVVEDVATDSGLTVGKGLSEESVSQAPLETEKERHETDEVLNEVTEQVLVMETGLELSDKEKADETDPQRVSEEEVKSSESEQPQEADTLAPAEVNAEEKEAEVDADVEEAESIEDAQPEEPQPETQKLPDDSEIVENNNTDDAPAEDIVTAPEVDTVEPVKSDVMSVETVKSDLVLVETIKSDLVLVETVKSDLVSVETIKSDLVTVETVKGDLVSVETAKSDLVSVETLNSDLVSVETAEEANNQDDEEEEYDVSAQTLEALLSELPPWRRKRGMVISLPKRLRETKSVIVGYVNGRPIAQSDRSLRRRSYTSPPPPKKRPVKSSPKTPKKTDVDAPVEDSPSPSNLTEEEPSAKPIEDTPIEDTPAIAQAKDPHPEPTPSPASKRSSKSPAKSSKKKSEPRAKRVEPQTTAQGMQDTLPAPLENTVDSPQSPSSKRPLRSARLKQAGTAASPPPAVTAAPPTVSPPPPDTPAPPTVSPPPAVTAAPPTVSPPPAVTAAPPTVSPPPAVIVSPPPAVTAAPPTVSPPPAVTAAPPTVSPPPAVTTAPPTVSPPPAVTTVSPPPADTAAPPTVSPPPADTTVSPPPADTTVSPPPADTAAAPTVSPPPAVTAAPPTVSPPPAITAAPPTVSPPPADTTVSPPPADTAASSVSPRPTTSRSRPSAGGLPLPIACPPPLDSVSPLPVSSPPNIGSLPSTAPEQCQQSVVPESTEESDTVKAPLADMPPSGVQKTEAESKPQAKKRGRAPKVPTEVVKNDTQQVGDKVSSPLQSQGVAKDNMQPQSPPFRSKRLLQKEEEANKCTLQKKPERSSLDDKASAGESSSSSASDKPARMPLRSESSKTDVPTQSNSQTSPEENKKSSLRSQRLASPSTSAPPSTAEKPRELMSPVRMRSEKIIKTPPKSSLSASVVSPPSSTPCSSTSSKHEPRKQTANKFLEALNGEENQQLITNLNIKFDKMQKGWVQLDKEGQPATKYRNKADRQAAIWKSKRRTRKPKSLEHQRYSPVQMLFMKNVALSSICRWFFESTETKSLVIVKNVNTRHPSETQLCFHSSSGNPGTSQGVFPSLQAERLKKHLKKFAIASPVKSTPRSQKLIAKALEQEASVVKGKEKKELPTATRIFTKPHGSSVEVPTPVAEPQKASAKSKNPASARILKKYSNIREKMQVQQTSVRLKEASKKSLKVNKVTASKSAAKSNLKSAVKGQKSPLPVGKRLKESVAKIEKKKTSPGKKIPVKPVAQEKTVKTATSSRASRDLVKKDAESPQRGFQRPGTPKTAKDTLVQTSSSKVESNKKQLEAEKTVAEKPIPPKATPPKATPPRATPPKATPPRATPPKATPPRATPPKATPQRATPPRASAKAQTKEPSQSKVTPTRATENKGAENAVKTLQQNVDIKTLTPPAADQVLTRSQRKVEALPGSPDSAPKKASKPTVMQGGTPKSTKSTAKRAREPTPKRGATPKSAPKKAKAPTPSRTGTPKSASKKAQEPAPTPAKRTRMSHSK